MNTPNPNEVPNGEAVERKFSGSEISRAAKAMHDKGRALGFFGMEWEKLPNDRKENYEHLALAALATLPPQTGQTTGEGWRPVTEAANFCKDGESYLIFSGWGRTVRTYLVKGSYAGFNWRGQPEDEPSHFMPLPLPPATGDTK